MIQKEEEERETWNRKNNSCWPWPVFNRHKVPVWKWQNSHIKNWWFSVWWDDRIRLWENREKGKLVLCCLPNHTSFLTTSWGSKIKATEVWKTITSISVPPWHHLEAGSLQHKSYYWFPAALRVKEISPSLSSNPSLVNLYTGVDPHKNV